MQSQLKEFMLEARPDTDNVNEIKQLFNNHPYTSQHYVHNKTFCRHLRNIGYKTKRTANGTVIDCFEEKKRTRLLDRVQPTDKHLLVRINDCNEKLDYLIKLLTTPPDQYDGDDDTTTTASDEESESVEYEGGGADEDLASSDYGRVYNRLSTIYRPWEANGLIYL